jgi:FkbM family methyltransferase
VPITKRFIARVLRRAGSWLLPQRRQLPFRHWLNVFEGGCENELRYFHQLVHDTDVAIDVGANEGLFSYAMSKQFSTVHSFEINDELTNELAAYNPGNIVIHHEGLSSRSGNATLYIPVLNGRPLTGWASLTSGNCPDTRVHVTKEVTIRTLDELALAPVSFIKIDVEGHELEVLKGAANTIARNRPILLMEVNAAHLEEATAYFSRLNYQRKKLQELVDVTGSPDNYLFLPIERTQQNESGPTGA